MPSSIDNDRVGLTLQQVITHDAEWIAKRKKVNHKLCAFKNQRPKGFSARVKSLPKYPFQVAHMLFTLLTQNWPTQMLVKSVFTYAFERKVHGLTITNENRPNITLIYLKNYYIKITNYQFRYCSLYLKANN